MKSGPWMLIAGLREEGAVCPRCDVEVQAGDQTASCPQCGNVHHWNCWSSGDGCAAYECAPERRNAADSAGVMRITMDDLVQAKPLPAARPGSAWTSAAPISLSSQPLAGPKRWNRLAIATLVVAILGIPLFGLITGLVAIVLGCIALAGHTRRMKGALVCVLGILLGVVDVAGWTIGLALWFQGAGGLNVVSISDFEQDPLALEQLPAPISRAMKSNVLIQTPADLGRMRGEGIGSGVIVHLQEGIAWIVTNRHVVDPTFVEDKSAAVPVLPNVRLFIKAIGQPLTASQLVWIAPNGIDLALVTMPVTSRDVMQAVWDARPKLIVGEAVFAVGNPHGLGWTHTQGSLSQLRLQAKGNHEVRVIQTSAAINPGNSGGGLYDSDGRLLGINTWTKDKRVAEGLSFSISFHTLLPLLPADYQLPASQHEADVP